MMEESGEQDPSCCVDNLQVLYTKFALFTCTAAIKRAPNAPQILEVQPGLRMEDSGAFDMAAAAIMRLAGLENSQGTGMGISTDTHASTQTPQTHTCSRTCSRAAGRRFRV